MLGLIHISKLGQAPFVDGLLHESIRRLIYNLPATFAYMPAGSMMDDPPSSAKYAVQFTVTVERRFQPPALAYLILRLRDSFISTTLYEGARLPNLIGISYRFSTTVLYGVLLYDEGLERQYEIACDNALNCRNLDATFVGDYPVVLWNASSSSPAWEWFTSHMEVYLDLSR